MYKTIRENFGGMPLAGYLMEIINMLQDKDGIDAINFLKQIDQYTEDIFKQSEKDYFKLKEFFFMLAFVDDVFAFDCAMGHTIESITREDYIHINKESYDSIKYFRMYTQDEEWGLDELEIEESNINIPKEPSETYTSYTNGQLMYKCPKCGKEFIVAPRCPECGQLIKENLTMEVKILNLRIYTSEIGNRDYEIVQLNEDGYAIVYEKEFVGFFAGNYTDDVKDIIDRYEKKIVLDKTKEIFQALYEDGEISDSDDADELIENMVNSLTDYSDDVITDALKEMFPIEKEYELVEIEMSRIREVREVATVYIAVPKGSMTDMCDWACDNYDEQSYLEWEEDDNEYGLKDFAIESDRVIKTDTYDKLNAYYDIDETLED